MQNAALGRSRILNAKKSATEVKAFQQKGIGLRPALRLVRGTRVTPVRSFVPLRIRGSRYLKLSASTTVCKAQLFEEPRVYEITPIGTPVPRGFTKIKVLNPADLKKNGRIIVVGDVHGCYNQFCSLLEQCNYDATRDNLIMAGDLVNKGPDSLKVLKKAMKLNAVVVRGNHEDNALAAYYSYCRGEEIAEKYEWVKELKKKQVAFLEGLPFAVRVPSHKLIVVHAGLVPGVELEKQDMFSMYRMRDLRKCSLRDTWVPLERPIEESESWASRWTGPEHVIFGHDSSRRLQTEPFATGIDTGRTEYSFREMLLQQSMPVGAVQGDALSACVLPPAKKIPNPDGAAYRENLGIEFVSIDVDGPKKMVFPKSPQELSKILTSSVTATDQLWFDMYSSFEEKEEEAVV